MSLDRCLFAVRLHAARDRPIAERRLDALRRVYGALGEVDVATRFLRRPRVLAGVVCVGSAAEPAEVVSWGAALPAPFRRARRLAESTAAELRTLPGSLAAIALADDRAVLVTGPGGVQSLFAAQGPAMEAWSTHALAAALLATGRAEIDPVAVAELVTWEFVGGDASLLAGVEAVAPATRIEIQDDGAETSVYFPAAERWAPLPGREAGRIAERALLDGLADMLAGASRPVLGLTGGVDSRTAAVALRELDVPVRAFTYVSDDAAARDAAAAAGVAALLGIPHAWAPIDLHDGEQGMRAIRGEAVWADGAAPAALGRVPFPDDASHWIAGIGAEVGRAFYYGWLGAPPARVVTGTLARVLFSDMDIDLAAAEPEVRRALRRRARAWLAQAAASGHTGWALLDVVYGEQRVRRWARAMVPRLRAHLVPAFASQPLAQALASLPLADRLQDGFARRFIAARVPELAPERPLQRRRVAPLARRQAVQSARRARARLRLPPLGRAPGTPWHRRPPWAERAELVEWLADGVLAAPLLADALGAGWQREARANFLRGEPHAAYLASWAAGPVALSEAVAAALR